ncbi:MAG: hypothetical protein FWH15_09080 [Betaproteobacteria bacterium]|nr:hypothetical protein [Betaproteobacteria bacterium]
MAFSSFSSTNPQTYPQFLGTSPKNVVIAITWRNFREMTGEKFANFHSPHCLPQTGAMPCNPPFFATKGGSFAALPCLLGAKSGHRAYTQLFEKAGKKIFSLPLTPQKFFKCLILKDFLICLFNRQRLLPPIRQGFSRRFQACIHRVIHSFWGEPGKILLAESVRVVPVTKKSHNTYKPPPARAVTLLKRGAWACFWRDAKPPPLRQAKSCP